MLEKNSESEVHVEKVEQRPTASIAFGLERIGLIAVQAPIVSCIILVALVIGGVVGCGTIAVPAVRFLVAPARGGAGAGRDGRDHWGKVFTSVLAGGGIRGGAVYGSSDRYAAEPATSPTRPADLAATVYHCLGIDPQLEIRDRLGRPVTLCEGTPLRGILG